MAVQEATTADVLVVGAGMVAHRFVDSLLSVAGDALRVRVIGEEPYGPYDRVGLSSFFAGARPEDLALDARVLDDRRVTFVAGDRAVGIDRASRTVRTASG